MAKNQKNYPEEFKIESVRLLESTGQSVSDVSIRLGINVKSLYRWRQKYGSHGTSTPSTLAKSPSSNTKQLEAELKRLKHENEILRQERDVLKKAISIISHQQE